MAKFFDPPQAKPLLPKEKIDKVYKSMRFKVFMGSFLGYAAYYLVRKNLSLAAPGMIEDGLVDKAGVGIAMSAVSIAYAFSKFIMGSVSDRSDARKFLVVGLVLSAITMMSVGLIPFGANQALNVAVIFLLMLIVGWLSGMGWPPCGRIMAHWFSQNERSFKMSIWNTSHTLRKRQPRPDCHFRSLHFRYYGHRADMEGCIHSAFGHCHSACTCMLVGSS